MKRIFVAGQKVDIRDDMTYRELADAYQKDYEYPIVLVLEKERHKMRELFRTAEDGCSVEFLTISDKAGYETRRTPYAESGIRCGRHGSGAKHPCSFHSQRRILLYGTGHESG